MERQPVFGRGPGVAGEASELDGLDEAVLFEFEGGPPKSLGPRPASTCIVACRLIAPRAEAAALPELRAGRR